MSAAPAVPATVRVGIGGWTFEPWRGSFYPTGLPHGQELRFASRQLGVIEVNGTYYGLQKPQTYAKWRDETPEGFVFSLKASRYATNRRVLADAGASVHQFIHSGIAELGPKLGPLLWQFAPTKRFDAADFAAFLALLPASVGGLTLRHAVDVRHPSFRCEAYLELLRRHGVTHVFTESDDYPAFADLSGDFVYARIMRTESTEARGLKPEVLASLADCAECWRQGREPSGLPRVSTAVAPVTPRDVFLFFIAAAKERAPAAAMALQQLMR